MLWRKNRATLLAALSLTLGAVLWEVLGRWVVNPLFLPPLSQVWVRFLELVQAGQLATDIAASSQAYLLGLAVAIAIGGTAGIAMAASKIIRDLLDPWVAILNATPTIALAPLFIVALGLGIESKVAVCAIVMLFPILINTYMGFSNTDEQLVETAKSYCASPRQIYTKVKLPMATPYLIAGLRLAAAHGLVGVVVSELFGARAGIGLLILNSAETFDSRALFVGIIILAVAGVTITYGLIWLERRLARWRTTEQEA
jgi:NitT/TauT family transport system permease protein